jgi:hypothetical protein
MSGFWIKLNDTHINCATQVSQDQPWGEVDVCRAITALYDVPSIIQPINPNDYWRDNE